MKTIDNNKNIFIIAPNKDDIGGISTWNKIIHYYNYKNLNLISIDCSGKTGSLDTNNLLKRIKRGIWITKNVLKQLNKKYSEEKCDLIHLCSSASLGLFKDEKIIKWAFKRKIPIVYHMHFGRIPDLFIKQNWEYRKIIKNCEFVDKVILIDEKSYKFFRKKLKNCVYVPNPIVTNKDYCDINSKKIMFLGHVVKEKGIDEIIAAWKVLNDSYPSWEINIYGPIKNNYIDEITIHQLKKIHIYIKGSVSHNKAMEALKNSSIFVLPSWTEGFPNVILEAMNCGLPIIATKVGAIPQMIEGCGVLINPKNVEELKKSLIYLINNKEERKKIGDIAKYRVVDNYDYKIVCSVYESIWEEILQGEKNDFKK